MSFHFDEFIHRHMPEFMHHLLRHEAPECLQDVDALQLRLEPVREHIHTMWKSLIRTHSDLYLDALFDPKVPRDPEAKRLLYISAKEDPAEVRKMLDIARESLIEKIICGEVEGVSEVDLPEIEIRPLPPINEPLEIADHQHSLMYLPYPYVVPGPRFNEMYNWDTAFVVRGLLDDAKYDLAKSFVENMLYQVEHYGTILNGNRTYYYDSRKSRSQPPLLTGKIVALYHHYDKLRRQPEESRYEWLERALMVCEDYYQHWVTPPHLHAESGLSMYNSELGFPAFEVIHSEKSHYEKALAQLREMHEKQTRHPPETPRDYQDRKDCYYLHQYYVPAEFGRPDALSANFYRGDRAMRETGFDPSRRFGFFNVDVINYLPTCLNSLRYKMEKEMSELYKELETHRPEGKTPRGKRYRHCVEKWEKRAKSTARLINQWLWDEGEQDENGNWLRKPCYHDYNMNTALCEGYDIPRFRDYDFITSFYPMWVGIASRQQAEALVTHLLPRLRTEWGVMTSTRQTGSQWDKPFCWAPLVVVLVEALERYAYHREALEVAYGFLNMIAHDHARTGKLYEKYDAIEGSSDVSRMIEMGYSENVEGFAWTNSAVLELSQALHRLNKAVEQQEG